MINTAPAGILLPLAPAFPPAPASPGSGAALFDASGVPLDRVLSMSSNCLCASARLALALSNCAVSSSNALSLLSWTVVSGTAAS
jgi:hypothetical protein